MSILDDYLQIIEAELRASKQITDTYPTGQKIPQVNPDHQAVTTHVGTAQTTANSTCDLTEFENLAPQEIDPNQTPPAIPGENWGWIAWLKILVDESIAIRANPQGSYKQQILDRLHTIDAHCADATAEVLA